VSAFWIGFLVGAPVWASIGFLFFALVKIGAQEARSDRGGDNATIWERVEND
jgi:hypothetical protein